MRKLIPFVFLAVCASMAAQSNDIIDKLLGQNPALLGETCYLVLTAGSAVPETAGVDDALAAALSRKWIKSGRTGTDPVRIDELSLLVMKALEMKGGVMYTIFPGRRYAFRELVYLGVLETTESETRNATGADVMQALLKAMELKEGEK